MYRAPSESAAAAEAYRQACMAYEALVQRQPRLAEANLDLLRRRERPIAISEYIAPEPPPAERPGESLAKYIQQTMGVTSYYVGEATRLDASLAQLTRARVEDARAPMVLGPAPRSVPFLYLVAELFRGFWLGLRFVLFPPITMAVGILAVGLDRLAPALTALPLAGVGVYAIVRFARRARYLAQGEVATVVARTLRTTTVRSTNVPRLHANGWHIALRLFTGRTVETELTYRTSAGIIGIVCVRGPEFHGVLLCLPDRANAAIPNTAFACTPVPDMRGQWRADAVPMRVWMTNIVGVVLATSYAVLVAMRILGQ